MSCKHGNWEPCEECDAEDALYEKAYLNGFNAATEAQAERVRNLERQLDQATRELEAAKVSGDVVIGNNVYSIKPLGNGEFEIRFKEAAKGNGQEAVEPFVVRHYSGDERPMIKGNGFDGLSVGDERQEAEGFVSWINKRLSSPPSTALEVELALREAAKVVYDKAVQRHGYDKYDYEQEILSLIPSPPSLDDYVKGVAMKCFKAGQKANGAVDSVAESIVDAVLREGK